MSADLTEVIRTSIEAVREGWSGHHFTRDGVLFEAPPVRDDGATVRLIAYAVETAAPLIEAAVRAQVAAEAVAYDHDDAHRLLRDFAGGCGDNACLICGGAS